MCARAAAGTEGVADGVTLGLGEVDTDGDVLGDGAGALPPVQPAASTTLTPAPASA